MAEVMATLPGKMVARAVDGREVHFRKLAVLSRRVAKGSAVVLRDVKQRGELWWAGEVEVDPARVAEHERLLALQDALIAPPPVTCDAVIEEVDGDAVRARLQDGRDVWFKSSKCRDYRGHLGLRVRVTIAPERVQAVEIAPEDVEKNAAWCKELEPKPVPPIRFK